MRKLTVNGVQLLDLIDSNRAFVDELGAVGCIRWSQREHIIAMVQSRDRNNKLLEFLARRSVADFNKFVEVLSKEQPHLVPLLVADRGETYFVSLYEYEVLADNDVCFCFEKKLAYRCVIYDVL